MATLHPFRALRPRPEFAAEVACVPYDVVSADEARALAAGKPRSFLHVIRPEIGLPEGTDEHADAVYQAGADALDRFEADGTLAQEATPALYVYRLVMGERAQTGVFGCVSVAEYDDGTILRHELTRPDKEDDRTRHLLAQRAHAEPVMLTFRDAPAVARLIAAATATTPLYDLTADDGVGHTLWAAPDPAALAAAFRGVPRLYVADGHHRCKAASRAYHALADEGKARPENPEGGRDANEAAFFPAAIFPMGEMAILPYNRVVRRLPDGPEAFEQALRARFDVRDEAPATPERAGDVSLTLGGGRWLGITLPETSGAAVADRLDVARLSEHLLGPLLGITDPRRDANLAFVGGIRGTAELERLVAGGRADLAISVYPTQMEQLLAVSDADELMPPKSTWFEPKLRSGFLVHRF